LQDITAMPAPASESVITVRPVQTVDEYRACQQIQRQAWGITEDGYVVPIATMISVQHAGGLVLGAFQGERLAGFAFGYLGRVRGRWALYSQLAGVDPTIQASGIGGQLKAAQRAWAKEQGLDLVAWSFDPLQAGNANFNLHRLGAFSRTYEVNYFGERTDTLNAGLDTDRLLVEWPTEGTGNREQGTDGGPPVDLLTLEPLGDGLSRPRPNRQPPTPNSQLRLDIPPSIAAVKARNPELAREWQLAVRAAFQQAFAGEYVAVDFGREKDDGLERAFYVLRRPDSGAMP
jgi:predicted GNAT superfamily acetyltransferase